MAILLILFMQIIMLQVSIARMLYKASKMNVTILKYSKAIPYFHFTNNPYSPFLKFNIRILKNKIVLSCHIYF